MHQEEGQLSFPASQLLLSYSQPQGEEESPKKRLPNPVTIPRKGPLLLQTSKGSPNKVVGDTEPKSPRRAAHRHYTNPRPQQRPKHSLTRFPVLMLQRPIEEIQSQLGKISCAELSENVKLLSQHQAPVHTLHPRMNYSALYGRLHGNHQTAHPPAHATHQYTHCEEGPMNISITYSRHLSSPPTHKVAHSSNIMTSHQNPWESHTTTTLTTNSPASQTGARLPSSRPVTSQRLYLSSTLRPSIAPHAVRAAGIHRAKPITASTVVQGRRIIRTHF